MIFHHAPFNWLAKVFLQAISQIVSRCTVMQCSEYWPCKHNAPIALNAGWIFGSQARHVSEAFRGTGTLKPSENILWASLNSGVEKDSLGSSFLRISSSCTQTLSGCLSTQDGPSATTRSRSLVVYAAPS